MYNFTVYSVELQFTMRSKCTITPLDLGRFALCHDRLVYSVSLDPEIVDRHESAHKFQKVDSPFVRSVFLRSKLFSIHHDNANDTSAQGCSSDYWNRIMSFAACNHKGRRRCKLRHDVHSRNQPVIERQVQGLRFDASCFGYSDGR
jgi:hypothetical protein